MRSTPRLSVLLLALLLSSACVHAAGELSALEMIRKGGAKSAQNAKVQVAGFDGRNEEDSYASHEELQDTTKTVRLTDSALTGCRVSPVPPFNFNASANAGGPPVPPDFVYFRSELTCSDDDPSYDPYQAKQAQRNIFRTNNRRVGECDWQIGFYNALCTECERVNPQFPGSQIPFSCNATNPATVVCPIQIPDTLAMKMGTASGVCQLHSGSTCGSPLTDATSIGIQGSWFSAAAYSKNAIAPSLDNCLFGGLSFSDFTNFIITLSPIYTELRKIVLPLCVENTIFPIPGFPREAEDAGGVGGRAGGRAAASLSTASGYGDKSDGPFVGVALILGGPAFATGLDGHAKVSDTLTVQYTLGFLPICQLIKELPGVALPFVTDNGYELTFDVTKHYGY